jgi:hypothetical protein
MKELNYGKWYKYAHDQLVRQVWDTKDTGYDTSWIDQEHFPSELKGRTYL